MRLVPCAAAILAVTLLIPSSVLAQSGEAGTHFKRGVSLYQEADFRGALVEFRRAHELSQNWRLLYNVAQAEYQMRDYAAALASFETYLREGGDKVPRARRTEVEQEITRLRARVGKLTIRVTVAGATVTLDDEVLGLAPLTRNVGVGARHLAVKKDGYVPWIKTLAVAGGDDLQLDAVLEPLAASPPPPPPPPPQLSKGRFPWEPWVVTGVLTAAAATTGVLALTASSKLESAKDNLDVTDRELDSSSSRVKSFALATDILIVAALVSAGVSVYFTIARPARVPPSASGLAAWGRF